MGVATGDLRASPRSAAPWAAAAVALFAGGAALFWPGFSEYDSVDQYRQALSGVYSDWHPPVMARVWQELHSLVGGGAGPLLLMQLAGWWLGLGLIAAALAAAGRCRAAAATLAIGVLPPFLGWQVVVLKDAQLAGALLAATGLVGCWRLRARALPWWGWAAVAVLLGYAALLRANAVFSVAPLIALLATGLRARVRVALAVALIAAGLGVAGPINHGLLGARHSGVERVEALYDLAGIAVPVPATATLPLTRAERDAIRRKHCATPFFWDPLGDGDGCAADIGHLQAKTTGALYRALAAAALAHPLAYARHRLSHLNMTERWLVPAGLGGAAPPEGSEPNRLGLADPGAAAVVLQRWTGGVVDLPVAWPIVWLVLAMAAIATARRRPPAPARDLALALAGSAVAQEASFAAISIASDLRYHLWTMLATALALVLLADRPPPKQVRRVWGAVLAIVLLAGTATRLALPRAPDDYAALLVWPAAPAL
ncbi:hypothetical protein [Sphingomonas sp.]|uniref:hypothetical protein n=1 Tax=Sphingomonas sp. TaxID=28214 RepID=UPI003CC62C3D